MIRKTIVALVLLVAVVTSAAAQSLLDDPEYRSLIDRVEELKAQAETAVDEGRYDDAVAFSNEAEQVAQQAEEYAEQRVLAFRANGWINRARQRIRYAESINAPVHYPEAWETANDLFDDAQASFEAEQWVEAIAASRQAFNALEEVRPVRTAQPDPEPAPQPASRPQADPEPAPEPEPVAALPRYYVVRLIPGRRDCFWRIAEYEFVYGDPWQWPALYEANRDKLPDPDNPDLILPGMIVEIPSINGEERTGYWNPQDLPEDAE